MVIPIRSSIAMMARSWSATGGLAFISYERSRTFTAARLSQYAKMLPGADESFTDLLYAISHPCVSSILRIRIRIFLVLKAEQACISYMRYAYDECITLFRTRQTCYTFGRRRFQQKAT